MLKIHLLGQPRLFFGDGPLKFSERPKTFTLLAYLLLHRQQALPRDTIAYALWPDVSDSNARTNLRRHLSYLRHALPNSSPDWLVNDGHTVEWNPNADFWLDVAEFERLSANPNNLQKAVLLYTGDLLETLYDDWALYERERLRNIYIADLKELVTQNERQRDYRAAIGYAELLLRHDPLNEQVYRDLMGLHASVGDRVSLVRTFHTCVAVLQRELQIEPTPETRQVFEQLVKSEAAPVLQSSASLPLVRTNNLPTLLTRFIGREREVDVVKELVTKTRLVTLTGAGGSGKTRLAIETIKTLLPDYPDGIWLINFAPLADPSLIPQTIANELGIREVRGVPLSETLIDSLTERSLLLVIDNCEHLIEPIARYAETLLHAAPNLRILATSREALGLDGEVTWYVPPLTLPNVDPFARATQNAKLDFEISESMRLFLDRAMTVLPTFILTRENAATLAQICRALDGIPLAIELAAARLTILSVEQIAERLDDRLNLLAEGSRTALPRQRTMRATLDWSYDLLSEKERLLLGRLAVFAGDFTVETIEAVCADEQILQSEILDLLSRLVDKSLIAPTLTLAHQARYRFLEIVREYATEKLEALREVDVWRKRHLDFFQQLAERAEPKLKSGQARIWIERLLLEEDNLRAALNYAVERGDGESAGKVVVALHWFWIARGQFIEEMNWIKQLLGASAPLLQLKIRAKVLFQAAFVSLWQGDQALALDYSKASLEIAQEANSPEDIAYALVIKGIIQSQLGSAEGTPTIENGLARFRDIGDKYGTANALVALGFDAQTRQDYERAIALSQEGLRLYREIGHPFWIATVLENLVHTMLRIGSLERALEYLGEAIAVAREGGDRFTLGYSLLAFAGVAVAQGKTERAATILGAIQSTLHELGMRQFQSGDQTEYERAVAQARTHLEAQLFEAAWAEGSRMTLDQAIDYALNPNL